VHLLHVYSNLSNRGRGPHELLQKLNRGPKRAVPSSTGQARKARQLRESEITDLVARYVECRNLRQLAIEFRVSRGTVSKHLAAKNVDTSRGMKDADIRWAVAACAAGQSSAAIGASLGFDNHTVIRALRGVGVHIRQPAQLRAARK